MAGFYENPDQLRLEVWLTSRWYNVASTKQFTHLWTLNKPVALNNRNDVRRDVTSLIEPELNGKYEQVMWPFTGKYEMNTHPGQRRKLSSAQSSSLFGWRSVFLQEFSKFLHHLELATNQYQITKR